MRRGAHKKATIASHHDLMTTTWYTPDHLYRGESILVIDGHEQPVGIQVGTYYSLVEGVERLKKLVHSSMRPQR
jgi:hypothetical protein